MWFIFMYIRWQTGLNIYIDKCEYTRCKRKVTRIIFKLTVLQIVNLPIGSHDLNIFWKVSKNCFFFHIKVLQNNIIRKYAWIICSILTSKLFCLTSLNTPFITSRRLIFDISYNIFTSLVNFYWKNPQKLLKLQAGAKKIIIKSMKNYRIIH